MFSPSSKEHKSQKSSEEKEKLYNLLESIYADKTLMDYQRRDYIYNICVKNWQSQLPENEKVKRKELELDPKNISDTGSICKPIFKGKTKK